MSYTFKIGQEVVCVRTGDAGNKYGKESPPLVRYKQYTVLDVKYCRKCGTQEVHVGLQYEALSGSSHCSCGHVEAAGRYWFVRSSRFVPLEEFKQSETALTELLNEIKIEI